MTSITSTTSTPHQAGYLVYIAGVEIPVLDASVFWRVWEIPTAQISCIPDRVLHRLGAEDRVKVEIFYLDVLRDPSAPEFRLLFEGDIIGWSYNSSTGNRSISLNCVMSIDMFKRLNFYYMSSITDFVNFNTQEGSSATSISQPKFGYPASLFIEGLVPVYERIKSQLEGEEDPPVTARELKLVKRPIDVVYNIIRGLIGSTVPEDKRAIPAVNFFARYVRKSNLVNRFAAFPILEETGRDEIFPILKAAGDATTVVHTLQNQVLPSVGNSGSIWDNIMNFLGVMFYELMMLPTAPSAVVRLSDGVIESPIGESAADPKHPFRVLNYFTKPQMLFSVAPTCNVIFPAQIKSTSFSENYIVQPTRTYVNSEMLSSVMGAQGVNKNFILNATTVGYPDVVNTAAKARIMQELEDKGYKGTARDFLIWPEEWFKGPVEHRLTLPNWLYLLAINANNDNLDQEEEASEDVGGDYTTALTPTVLKTAADISIESALLFFPQDITDLIDTFALQNATVADLLPLCSDVQAAVVVSVLDIAAAPAPAPTARTVPAGESTGSAAIDTLKAAILAKGYKWFDEPLKLNLIGVRNPAKTGDSFDDDLCVAWKEKDGTWKYAQYPCTTDPAVQARKYPPLKKGVAILIPGQYDSYEIGYHKKYEAIIQRRGSTVRVWRDNNKDAVLDFGSGKEEAGDFRINIHRAFVPQSEVITTTKKVDGKRVPASWSEGCTVFKRDKDFQEVMSLARRCRTATGNRFVYTLLEKADLSVDISGIQTQDAVTPVPQESSVQTDLGAVDNTAQAQPSDSKAAGSPSFQTLFRDYAEYEHQRKRYESRGGAINSAFDPYVIPGFPCWVFDRRSSAYDLVGYVYEVSWALGANRGGASMSTTISYGNGRTFQEMWQSIVENVRRKNTLSLVAPTEPIEDIRNLTESPAKANEFYQALLYSRGETKTPPAFIWPDFFDMVDKDGVARPIPGFEDTAALNESTVAYDSENQEDIDWLADLMEEFSGDDLQPKEQYKNLFESYDAAMKFKSRPICTLKEYVRFLHGGKSIDTLVEDGSISGESSAFVGNSKTAVFYEKIRDFIPAQGETPTSAQTGISEDGTRTVDEREGADPNFPQSRADWTSALLSYRRRILRGKAPQR